jgi:hypothetical protein
MATQANVRGGYIKTMEISQDESNQSKCMLSDEFLKKAENYVLQVTRFISNVTPNINTYDENVLEVLRRPAQGEAYTTVAAIAGQNLPESIRIFKPQHVKTTLEMVRQMMVFSARHDGLTITLDQDNKIVLSLSADFGQEYYVRVGPITQKLLGLREYYYYFRYTDLGGVLTFLALNNEPDYAPGDNVSLFLTVAQAAVLVPAVVVADNFSAFRHAVAGMVNAPPHGYASANPISCLDTRLSLDVQASFPLSTQHQILNGAESHDYLLGRFPIGDYIDHHVSYTDQNQFSVLETVNLGLEDLCRKNPNTIANYLLPGEIRVVNIDIWTRYVEDQKIIRVPTDYSNGGFFSLKLMFSKKQK